jgi:hypothetical protein
LNDTIRKTLKTALVDAKAVRGRKRKVHAEQAAEQAEKWLELAEIEQRFNKGRWTELHLAAEPAGTGEDAFRRCKSESHAECAGPDARHAIMATVRGFADRTAACHVQVWLRDIAAMIARILGTLTT